MWWPCSKRRVLAFFAALVIALEFAPGAIDAAAQAPDITKGEINGRMAMIAIPVFGVERTEGGARMGGYLPVEGCNAHLAPVENLETELTYPCGKWFQPPEGAYRMWLEGPDQISEGTSVVMWEDQPFEGVGLSAAMGMSRRGRSRCHPA